MEDLLIKLEAELPYINSVYVLVALKDVVAEYEKNAESEYTNTEFWETRIKGINEFIGAILDADFVRPKKA